MDFSAENIKMVDCPEIQDSRPDCYKITRISGIPYRVYCGGGCNFWFNLTNQEDIAYKWLPRQDQLLGMLDNHKEPLIIEMINVHQWHIRTFSADTGERLIRDVYNRKSCEIALLEIVMILLHNKKWNGKEWVKL